MTGAYGLCLLCNPLKRESNTLDVFFSSLNAKLFLGGRDWFLLEPDDRTVNFIFKSG